MTIAVDRDVKQQNKQNTFYGCSFTNVDRVKTSRQVCVIEVYFNYFLMFPNQNIPLPPTPSKNVCEINKLIKNKNKNKLIIKK